MTDTDEVTVPTEYGPIRTPKWLLETWNKYGWPEERVLQQMAEAGEVGGKLVPEVEEQVTARVSELPSLPPAPPGTCAALISDRSYETARCAQTAGHYDEFREPDHYVGEPGSPDPGGWHQSGPDADGVRVTWADRAEGATPHRPSADATEDS
jgi:hypothetical protein